MEEAISEVGKPLATVTEEGDVDLSQKYNVEEIHEGSQAKTHQVSERKSYLRDKID